MTPSHLHSQQQLIRQDCHIEMHLLTFISTQWSNQASQAANCNFFFAHCRSRSRSQLPLPLPAPEDPAAIPPVGVEETGVKVVQFSGVANTSESLALLAKYCIYRVYRKVLR
ncbi:hypothetical protein Pcinc_007970 [Petrolisthes cinctipes]|uniref:Uncharacterized protein n=1 Tax=Petrolisthes cinctipes TaxID=88211 RepID=A0AAE1KXQ6_PETCI|nr:hypothetical protein Pcinc_013005 [Petrolisthes cinctipes]KAK3887948.1 hypothetical protein Pcinc_007970 [Petrolisthes cinctipes]